jgi:alanine racemase
LAETTGMHDPTATPDCDQAGAILTIDLDAIRENYRRLRARLGDADCAAVVKADGYGLGAAQVALALRKEGCGTFFVAHALEGLSLRQTLGADPDIFLLNGIHPGAEDDCAAAGLIAMANSAEQLAAWQAAARRRGGGKKLPVAVQVDSGMSRLGMSPAEVESIAADGGAFDGLDLRLVMSHLACADEPDNPANEAQRQAFEALRQKLPQAPASLANSSGIFLGEDFRYDLARPGAALYGVNPTPGKDNPMRQVVRLDAKVIQARDLEAGTGVGYGYAFRTTGPLRLATIALGYADGWPRRAAAAAWLNGVRLPFAGRISMDSIVIDISELPPARLQPGDLVQVIGEDQTVDELATVAGTIGYEILTGLGRRFHRRYEGG